MIAIIIGIDHGYYAIKTRQVSFPSGIIGYDYEPYTMQNVLQYQGKYYVCGTGRQTLVKNKTSNDNYYLLTLAAIAEEIKHRKAERKTEVILAVGLPLSSFGREKQGFREYLLRKEQPVRFLYESELYEIRIKDVKLFPQGYSALALHGNSFRLGVSGSGKSFSAKEEIVHLALATDDDILILDPESEFTKLVEALGGQVVKVSATSDNHLNAMDMDAAYGNEKNPLIEKSEFILSVFEQLVGAGNLSAKEKSILDRCAADVYRDYIRSGYTGEVPTLKDMYRQLMLQPEEEARGLALSSELFINGSLNTFAQPTNVNKKNRIMDYDIRELGEQLMPLGMLVTLDSIFNRVIQNWKEGKTTWIFADEFYLLFRYEYSANFFYAVFGKSV